MPDQFKDRLRKWRESFKTPLYQKEAADILSVSAATVRKWEAGKRTPTKLSLAEIERRMEAHKQ